MKLLSHLLYTGADYYQFHTKWSANILLFADGYQCLIYCGGIGLSHVKNFHGLFWPWITKFKVQICANHSLQ